MHREFTSIYNCLKSIKERRIRQSQEMTYDERRLYQEGSSQTAQRHISNLQHWIWQILSKNLIATSPEDKN